MVGIDLGSKSIKVVSLAKTGNDWILRSSGAVGFSGVTPDRMTDEKEFVALSEIIKKLLKTVNITEKDIVISIPEQLVFTRVIKFPKLSDEEVAAAVKWEAEQYIPIPINEAIVQHTILDNSEKATNVSVLLVAAPKVVVEKYIKIYRLAGLSPIAAETELISLTRSMAPENGVAVLVDLGLGATDLAITVDAKLSYSRSIPIAGEALTRAVAQGLGVDPAQAEEYKKTYGMTASQLEGRVKNAMEPVLRMIVDEIKKSIHFYQTDSNGQPPTSIIITGGSGTMPDLVSYLTSALGIEAVAGNSFGKIKLEPETVKSLAPYMPLYGVSVGLAMREE